MSDCSDEKPCAVCSGGGEACELAKVRAKSEERRRLLESGAWNLDDLDRWYCHECTATSYVGLSGTGMPPAHAAGCAVAKALKEDA